MSVASELTKIAKAQIGNGGSKYRKWYYGTSSDCYGIEWCAVFVSWLFNQIGGINKYIIKSDGAGSFARYGDGKLGRWYKSGEVQPQEGDIITFRWGGRYTDKYHSDHVGYVYAVDKNCVYTIEGNTGGGDSDTSSVMYRYYGLTNSAINGYYRPYYTKKEEKSMNFEKGDSSDGVLAYKSLLIYAYALGLIKSKVDDTNGFGEGTYKATVEVQKKYNLDVDGIAGKNTITALRNAIRNEVNNVRNSVITNTIDYLKKELS